MGTSVAMDVCGDYRYYRRPVKEQAGQYGYDRDDGYTEAKVCWVTWVHWVTKARRLGSWAAQRLGRF